MFTSGKRESVHTPSLKQVTNKIKHYYYEQIKDNLANLKRMFLVFDKHLDGFVSLEELKSALDQFVMPLSNSVFAQLMTRYV